MLRTLIGLLLLAFSAQQTWAQDSCSRLLGNLPTPSIKEFLTGHLEGLRVAGRNGALVGLGLASGVKQDFHSDKSLFGKNGIEVDTYFKWRNLENEKDFSKVLIEKLDNAELIVFTFRGINNQQLPNPRFDMTQFVHDASRASPVTSGQITAFEFRSLMQTPKYRRKTVFLFPGQDMIVPAESLHEHFSRFPWRASIASPPNGEPFSDAAAKQMLSGWSQSGGF